MFSKNRFIFGNVLYAILNSSLIYSVLTPYIRSVGINPLQLSTIQSIESLFWFISMYISGIIFDRFGAKISFFIGRIFDLISIFFLLNPTFYYLIISYIFIGISKGFIYGKYESYMYNFLSVQGELKLYPRIAGIYYFFWDISLSCMAFISSILLNHNTGYNLLIYITICIKIFSLFSILFFIQGNKNSKLSFFKNDSIKQIFIDVFNCIKKSTTFKYLIIFYGVLNFFTYPLCLVIGDMILVDMGYEGTEIARYTSLIVFTMAFGTILPIIFFSKGIKTKYCLCLSIIQIILMVVSAIFYNTLVFIIAAVFINFTFALIEVSIEKNFEKYSNKKIRGSAISLSISIGTLLRMFNIMLIGFIAKNYSYQIGLIFILLLLLIFLLFINFKLKNFSE